ncbi:MAG: hypothetical protein HY671_07795 [Chloroflexi bacterium]|nr:hypothetical protein [Chloroflexota bacterium]
MSGRIAQNVKQWLGGLCMSQFSPRSYFGYSFVVRPGDNDWLRRHLIVSKYSLSVLPYFAGADLVFNLRVTPTENAVPCAKLRYDWYLFRKGEKDACNRGHWDIVSPRDEYKGKIDLGHFAFTDEYRLDLEVTANGDKDCQTVADFEITSRANMQMAIIWFFLATALSVVMFLLGLWMGGKT